MNVFPAQAVVFVADDQDVGHTGEELLQALGGDIDLAGLGDVGFPSPVSTTITKVVSRRATGAYPSAPLSRG